MKPHHSPPLTYNNLLYFLENFTPPQSHSFETLPHRDLKNSVPAVKPLNPVIHVQSLKLPLHDLASGYEKKVEHAKQHEYLSVEDFEKLYQKLVAIRKDKTASIVEKSFVAELESTFKELQALPPPSDRLAVENIEPTDSDRLFQRTNSASIFITTIHYHFGNQRSHQVKKDVVVKQIYSQDEFANEKLIHEKLSHSCIVTYFTAWQNQKSFFIAMEYLPSGTLQSFIELYARDYVMHLRMLTNIAFGLCYLLQQSVIHHDIKPTNIFLDKKINPKLGDFGSAEIFDAEKSNQVKKFGFTFGFAAPEILAQKNYNFAVDVFSFGVVAYELLTRKKLSRNFSPELLGQVDPPQWCNHGSFTYGQLPGEEVKATVEACFDKQPLHRPKRNELYLFFKLEYKKALQQQQETRCKNSLQYDH